MKYTVCTIGVAVRILLMCWLAGHYDGMAAAVAVCMWQTVAIERMMYK